MLQCQNGLSSKSSKTGRRFYPLFMVVILAFLSLGASTSRAQDRSPDDLRKLNQSVDALVRKVSPSVVHILVTGYGPVEEGDRANSTPIVGQQLPLCSGILV